MVIAALASLVASATLFLPLKMETSMSCRTVPLSTYSLGPLHSGMTRTVLAKERHLLGRFLGGLGRLRHRGRDARGGLEERRKGLEVLLEV